MMVEQLILIGGLVVLESAFHELEKFCDSRRYKLHAVKHAAYTVWLIHPAVLAGCEKWLEHNTIELVVHLLHG